MVKLVSSLNFFSLRRTRSRKLDSLFRSFTVWTGPVTVGGQTFNCYFDTGSTDLSIASSSCTDPSCEGKARYDVSKSPTARATTFKVVSSWSTGSSGNGLLVRDTVTIGKTTVNSQDVVAETAIGSYVSTRAADG